jgi:hypothetical protein
MEQPLSARHRTRFHERRGRGCLVCQHKDRVRIEASRVAGVSLDNLSRKFAVSRDSIFRHMRDHVDDDLRAQYLLEVPIKDLAEAAAAENVSVLEYLSIVRATLLQQFQLAASCNDKNGVAILGGRLTEVLRAIGSITGEVLRSPAVSNVVNTINFTASPVFLDLQQMLIRRLAGHPEAMAAVVEGLRELESRSAPQMTPLVIEHQGGAHAVA